MFIQSTDNEARRRDHLEGKQVGWLRWLAAAWQAVTTSALPAPCQMASATCRTTPEPRCSWLPCMQYLGWLAIREKHKELMAKYGGGFAPPLGSHADAQPSAARCAVGGG